jgi:hypothetical protein
MALVGMSVRGKELSEAERLSTVAAIVSESESVVTAFRKGKEMGFELRSNMAAARN